MNGPGVVSIPSGELIRVRQESLKHRIQCFDRILFPSAYPMKVNMIDYCYTERMAKQGLLRASIFIQFHCPQIFAGILADWDSSNRRFIYQGMQFCCDEDGLSVSTEVTASPWNNQFFKSNVFQIQATQINLEESDILLYPEYLP